MNKLYGLVLFSSLMLNANAQDIIIKKNGDEIKSKILEVDSSDIKYKKFENIDGPDYIVPKSDVFIIKYENGKKDIINRIDVPEISEKNKKIINEKKLFQEEHSYVSFGYGFGTFIGPGSSDWLFGNNNNYSSDNYYNKNFTGPLYVKYEYGIAEDFGIGITLAYLKFKYDYSYYDYNSGSYSQVQYIRTSNYTTFSGLLRANWHFGNSGKIDPYYGLGLGYRNGTWKYTSNNQQERDGNTSITFPFGFETTFGIRIKIAEHMGAYAEAGIAKSAVQFGFLAKF